MFGHERSADPSSRSWLESRVAPHADARPNPGANTMTNKPEVSRRSFLETAGAATGALVAAGTFAHPAIGKVKGANERINFAILGPGGRAQAHIKHLLAMKKEGRPVDIIGVCDVWDGYDGEVMGFGGKK